MPRLKKVAAVSLLFAVSAFGLYGCGAEAPTPTPVPATATTAAIEEASPTPMAEEPTATVEPTAMGEEPTATAGDGGGVSGDAIQILTKSGEAMKSLKSYHFTSVTETSAGTFTTEADVEPPDRQRITTDVGGVKSEVIVIGDVSYLQTPGTDTYTEIQAPTARTDATDYLKYADSAEVVGDEQVDGVSTTHIKFTYDQDKLLSDAAAQTGNPTPAPTGSKVVVDAWIEKSTGYTRQMKYETDIPNSGKATVTTTFSKFNEPISPPIEKPTNVTTMPGIPAVTPPAP